MAELSWRASYAVVVRSRVRAQLSYRSSFLINVLTAFGIGGVEFLELYVLLTNVPVLGGLDLDSVVLVFALANLGFSIADLIFGQLDELNRYLREGRLEALLVRPMPLLAQFVTIDFELRRVGRAGFALVVGVVALVRLDLTPDLRTVYLLVITPLAGAAIYGAMFALAGAIQFWLVDAPEFTNAFVYGGSYVGQIPGSTLLTPMRVLFTFVVPATMTAYLPTLLIIDQPGPALLPSWLGWLAPLFAVTSWLLAWAVWRTGLRRFTGAGG